MDAQFKFSSKLTKAFDQNKSEEKWVYVKLDGYVIFFSNFPYKKDLLLRSYLQNKVTSYVRCDKCLFVIVRKLIIMP